MSLLERHGNTLLISAVVGVITFTMWGLAALNSDAHALRKASLENIYWTAAQLELQNERLLSGLARLKAGDASVSAEELQQDFDILWSRASLFENGPVGERLRAHAGAPETITAVREALEASVDDIEALATLGSGAAERMLSRFKALRVPLREVSTNVLASDEHRLAESRKRMRDSVQRTSAAVFFGLLSAVLIIGASIVTARRTAQLATRNAEFAERAKVAAAEKSRFLAMISHELRTPLNGILASLALARRHAPTADPTPYLERAAQSGRAMTVLLSDALDHYAPGGDAEAQAQQSFAPQGVAELVEGILLSYASSSHISVAKTGDLPASLVSDVGRLRLAAAHLALAGEAIAPSRITARLSWTPGAQCDGALELSLVFVKPSHGQEAYELSQAASFARELIDRLEGNLTVEAGDQKLTVALRLTVAAGQTAEAEEGSRPLAACILSRSKSMKRALSALLGARGVDVFDPDASLSPDLVLVELGDETEPERLAARLRTRFHAARLVAIGDSRGAHGFDAMLPKRLEPGALYTATGLC